MMGKCTRSQFPSRSASERGLCAFRCGRMMAGGQVTSEATAERRSSALLHDGRERQHSETEEWNQAHQHY